MAYIEQQKMVRVELLSRYIEGEKILLREVLNALKRNAHIDRKRALKLREA